MFRISSNAQVLVLHALAGLLALATTNREISSRFRPYTAVEAFTISPSALSQNRNTLLFSRSNPKTQRSATSDNAEDTVVFGEVADVWNKKKFLETIQNKIFSKRMKKEHVDSAGVFRPPRGSMAGKTVLITGASTGLGLESAKRLALAGATVVMTVRNADKGIRAVRAVEEFCHVSAFTDFFVHSIVLDLDCLSSVRSFPDRWKDHGLPKCVNVLMNNAGAAGWETLETTVDGFERIFQSCYLGHFVLTSRLLEEGLLNGAEGCTVINVSSLLHRSAEASYQSSSNGERTRTADDVEFGFDFDNINSELGFSSQAYAQAKLANILFTKEFTTRAQEIYNGDTKTSSLNAVSMEPGIVATDMWRYTSFGYDPRNLEERVLNGEDLKQPSNWTWVEKLVSVLFYNCMTPVEQGANCQVYLAYAAAATTRAEHNNIQAGQHYNEFGAPVPVPEFAANEESARRLWRTSEDLAGARFGFSTKNIA